MAVIGWDEWQFTNKPKKLDRRQVGWTDRRIKFYWWVSPIVCDLTKIKLAFFTNSTFFVCYKDYIKIISIGGWYIHPDHQSLGMSFRDLFVHSLICVICIESKRRRTLLLGIVWFYCREIQNVVWDEYRVFLFEKLLKCIWWHFISRANFNKSASDKCFEEYGSNFNSTSRLEL